MGSSDPVDIAWRAGDPDTPVRRRAGRPHPDRARREARRRPVPGHQRRSSRPAASRGCSGLAFPPDASRPAVLRVLHRRCGDQVVASLRDARRDDPDGADPGSEAIVLRDARSVREPQRRRPGVRARWVPVCRHRRRRWRRRPARLGPAPRHAAGQGPASRRRARRRRGPPYRSPPTTRSRRRPALARRSGSPACATRGASGSIGRPATCGSATSGRARWEEIDVARAGVGGLDFGWNVMEGTHCYPDGGDDCPTDGLTLPVTEYGHDEGCSVTGGTVYRGSDQPALRGWYVFADYCSGRVLGDRPAGDDAATTDPRPRQRPPRSAPSRRTRPESCSRPTSAAGLPPRGRRRRQLTRAGSGARRSRAQRARSHRHADRDLHGAGLDRASPTSAAAIIRSAFIADRVGAPRPPSTHVEHADDREAGRLGQDVSARPCRGHRPSRASRSAGAGSATRNVSWSRLVAPAAERPIDDRTEPGRGRGPSPRRRSRARSRPGPAPGSSR